MRAAPTARVALLGCLVALPCDALGAQNECIADLSRGINLNGWLNPRSKEFAGDAAPTGEELTRLRSRGFTYARVAFDPTPIVRDSSDVVALFSRLGSALELIEAGGLGIVVDLHPPSTEAERVFVDREYRESYGRVLRLIAGYLVERFPCSVLELLNEPHAPGAATTSWSAIQSELVEWVRQAAPELTVSLSGDDWASFAALVRLRPGDDKHVVYTFHYYRPAAFTLQGAFWGEFGETAYPSLALLPYPVQAQQADSLVAASLARLEGQEVDRLGVEALVRGYARSGWGPHRIQDDLAQVGRWAREHRVKVYMGEFGVWANRADPASRSRWLEDVRRAAEGEGLGWALWQFWDYGSGFGLIDRARRIDPTVVDALGLAREDGR